MALRRDRDAYDGVDRRDPSMILVVNDEEDGARLLERLLERQGYRVATAGSFDTALVTAGQTLPRAVVADLSHGGIGSNLRLLEGLRHHDDRRVATTRIVLIARQSSNRVFSFQSGADAFITRPFHADELIAKLAEILGTPFTDLPQHRRDQLEDA